MAKDTRSSDPIVNVHVLLDFFILGIQDLHMFSLRMFVTLKILYIIWTENEFVRVKLKNSTGILEDTRSNESQRREEYVDLFMI